MEKQLTILLGNDDGIEARGLRSLAKELGKFANVYIAAPRNQKSAFSHHLSCRVPLYCGETTVEGAKKAWYIDDGSPADAMKLGLEVLLKDCPPDLVVAGINEGPNLGTDVYYSGTIAAAFEGHFLGIPSLAVSANCRNEKEHYNFDLAAAFAGQFIRWWAAKNFQPRTYFNINTPEHLENTDKIAFTSIGVRLYNNVFDKIPDESGRECYQIGGMPDDSRAIPNSDVDYAKQGYITISPIGNDMTDYRSLQKTSVVHTADILQF